MLPELKQELAELCWDPPISPPTLMYLIVGVGEASGYFGFERSGSDLLVVPSSFHIALLEQDTRSKTSHFKFCFGNTIRSDRSY